jgi:putative NIF3 family GTP cyclohydrolase 1 type 2
MTLSEPIQASLLKLSARGISVFSPHTSLDATPKGINTW